MVEIRSSNLSFPPPASSVSSGRLLWGSRLQYSMKRPSLLPVCLLNNSTPPLPPAVEWTYGGEPVGVCLHASARFASVIAAWLAFFRVRSERRGAT